MPHDPSATRCRVGTFLFSNAKITFNVDGGYRKISLRWVSGDVYYKGNLFLITDGNNQVDSVPLKLITIFEVNGDNAIDGFEVDATAGEVEIAILK